MKKLLHTLLFSIMITFSGYGQNNFYQGNGFTIMNPEGRVDFFNGEARIMSCFRTNGPRILAQLNVTSPDEFKVVDKNTGTELRRFFNNYLFENPNFQQTEIRKVSDNSLLVTISTLPLPTNLVNGISFQSPQLNNDTLVICEKLDNSELNLTLNNLNGGNCSQVSNYQNLSFQSSWFVNGVKKSTSSQYYFDKTTLKDGDKIKFVLYENLQILQNYNNPNCSCIELTNGTTNNYIYFDTLVTKEIVVKFRKNEVLPQPIFVNGINSICPGDTAILQRSSTLKDIVWSNDNDSTIYKKITSTRFNVPNPVYIRSRLKKANGCYALSENDTIIRKNCNGKMIRGYVYEDLDNSYGFSPTKDRVFANVKVQLRGSNQFAFTDSKGVYVIQPASVKRNVTFYVDIVDPDYSSGSSYGSFNYSGDSLYSEAYLSTYKLSSSDLALRIESGRSRPGFTIPIYFNITNQGKLTNGGTLNVTLDNAFTYSSASKTPKTISGKTLTFAVDSMASSLNQTITIFATLATTTALGSTVNTTASLTTTKTDVNLANNTFVLASTVSGSFDPNDIAVTPKGLGAKGAIRDTVKLDYTIRFQNMGTDTAFTVVVKSKLPNGVDFSKFQMLNASHNYSLSVKNDTIIWTFNNILLPDNKVNEPKSHGLIRYKIHQKAGNLTGTEIKNKAAIYFDFNAPVITNEVLNTVDNTIAGIESEGNLAENGAILFPNPSEGQLFVQAKESGILKMYNSLGSLAFTSDYEMETNINTSTLPKGVYFYQLEGTQHKVSGKVILK